MSLLAGRQLNVLTQMLFCLVFSSFKQFLELEPQLRDILQEFHQSRYTSCLRTLQEMMPTFMLDLYLSSHLNTLYTMIRNKALIQVLASMLYPTMQIAS